jgi:hypothetical protein
MTSQSISPEKNTSIKTYDADNVEMNFDELEDLDGEESKNSELSDHDIDQDMKDLLKERRNGQFIP